MLSTGGWSESHFGKETKELLKELAKKIKTKSNVFIILFKTHSSMDSCEETK